MALVRGRVAEVLDGDAAWRIIDRISRKYTGQPYPTRTDPLANATSVEHRIEMSVAYPAHAFCALVNGLPTRRTRPAWSAPRPIDGRTYCNADPKWHCADRLAVQARRHAA
jgi:hypothetical protein